MKTPSPLKLVAFVPKSSTKLLIIKTINKIINKSTNHQTIKTQFIKKQSPKEKRWPSVRAVWMKSRPFASRVCRLPQPKCLSGWLSAAVLFSTCCSRKPSSAVGLVYGAHAGICGSYHDYVLNIFSSTNIKSNHINQIYQIISNIESSCHSCLPFQWECEKTCHQILYQPHSEDLASCKLNLL